MGGYRIYCKVLINKENFNIRQESEQMGNWECYASVPAPCIKEFGTKEAFNRALDAIFLEFKEKILNSVEEE